MKSSARNIDYLHRQSSTSTASVSQSLAHAGSLAAAAHQQSSQTTNTFFKRCSPELMQVGGSVDSVKEGRDVGRERQLHQLRLQNASLRLDKQQLRTKLEDMNTEMEELNNLI